MNTPLFRLRYLAATVLIGAGWPLAATAAAWLIQAVGQ